MPFSPRRRFSLRALGGTAVMVAVLALSAAGAQAASPYHNPFQAASPYQNPFQAASPYHNPFAGDVYNVGRTDMGVDVCLQPREPIDAVGDGVVTGITRDWYAGEPYLWYQLTSGPAAGRYVYVAEQIHHLAHVGQRLHAGQVVARFARSGSCIETGWAASDGWTLAQVTTGYHEGQVTKAGVSFARFLMAVGVQGSFELKASRR
jgi:hypothetical protein